MPLFLAKKINAKWDKTNAQTIQLDRSLVQAIVELVNSLIRLSFDHRVHQCINIVIADIPEDYNVLLSRDWSSKLQGYFAIDWSQLWLPYKGKKTIKFERKVKHTLNTL